jgi:hypothetical protein
MWNKDYLVHVVELASKVDPQTFDRLLQKID